MIKYQNIYHLDAQNKHEEALSLCKKELKNNKKDADLQNLTGVIYAKLDKKEKAKRHFREAIRINPNMAESYTNLGTMAKNEGKNDFAMHNYRKAADLNPSDPVNLYNIIDFCRSIGEFDLVRSYIDAGLNSRMPETYIESLLFYLYEGSYDKFQALLGEYHNFPLDNNSLGMRHMLNAIYLWIQGHISQCKDAIAQAEATPMNPSYKHYANFSGYGIFLKRLCSYKTHEYDKSIHFIGDSNSLTGANVAGNARLVLGAKAYNISSNQDNLYKRSVREHVSILPSGSTAVFTAGGIDCRHDSGILTHCDKYGKDPIKVASVVACGYVDNIVDICSSYGVTPVIWGVAAPSIDTVEEAIDNGKDVVSLISKFNQFLQEACNSHNIPFIDVYSKTNSGNGIADGTKHIDKVHLNPDAFRDIFLSYYKRAID
jgi:hypothetical protein